jgi:hypothetical protein
MLNAVTRPSSTGTAQESSDPRSFLIGSVPASPMSGITRAFGTMQDLPASCGRYLGQKAAVDASVWPVTIAAAGLAK